MKKICIPARCILLLTVSVLSTSCGNETTSSGDSLDSHKLAVNDFGNTQTRAISKATVVLPTGNDNYHIVDATGVYSGDLLTISKNKFSLKRDGKSKKGSVWVVNDDVWRLTERRGKRKKREFVYVTQGGNSPVLACWGATKSIALACEDDADKTYFFDDVLQAENFQIPDEVTDNPVEIAAAEPETIEPEIVEPPEEETVVSEPVIPPQPVVEETVVEEPVVEEPVVIKPPIVQEPTLDPSDVAEVPVVPETDPGDTEPTIGAATALEEWDPSVPLPAFPGAEGFGASTVGGRGGKIFEISNLNDSGTGSFRACAEANVPRICIFKTGGLITLDSTIKIKSPYITIAGQTAPGGGISIRTRADYPFAAIKVQAHDVVIRYLRIRPGASYVMGDTQDALTLAGSSSPVYNVIVDHTSLSWASDEVAQVWYDAHDITFQWNIISEGLHCSNHPDAGCAHSKGLLLGSAGSHSMSVHHNLFAHHSERNPRMAMSGVADVVNNVVYNPKHSASQITNAYGTAQVNYVNNYVKKGVDSLSDDILSLKSYTNNPYELFVKGNIGPRRKSSDLGEKLVVKDSSDSWKLVSRHKAPLVTTFPCESADDCQAYEEVIAGAGARLPIRDAVDKRIIAEVKTGTGRIIDSQSQADCFLDCKNFLSPADYTMHGITDPLTSDGWPILDAGQPYPDQDGDGMDDTWEYENGLDSAIDDSAGHQLHGGYTNIEVFLNSL